MDGMMEQLMHNTYLIDSYIVKWLENVLVTVRLLITIWKRSHQLNSLELH